jgi:hypothetical protein
VCGFLIVCCLTFLCVYAQEWYRSIIGGFIFSFLRNSILISIVDALVYISTDSGSPPPLLALTVYVLDDCHSNWVEMESQWCFDLYFLHDSRCWTLLPLLIAFCTSSFENYLFNSICLFINWIVLLVFSFLNFLYILDINPLSNEW